MKKEHELAHINGVQVLGSSFNDFFWAELQDIGAYFLIFNPYFACFWLSSA